MQLSWQALPHPLPPGLTLLTRHSIRDRVKGKGFATYAMPLNEAGQKLADLWGQWLYQHLDAPCTACVSSPVGRCVETAQRILASVPIDKRPAIQEIGLLVEPGSLVTDVTLAGPQFVQRGAVGFINGFLARDIEGMKTPEQGAYDILHLLFTRQPAEGWMLAVSHDTILAALLGVCYGWERLEKQHWPDMMEGVWIWFEPMSTPDIVAARVNLLWRGEHRQIDMRTLV